MKRRTEHIFMSISVYAALCLAASMLFYDSLMASLVFIPLYFPFEKYVRKVKRQRYEEDLADQFIKALVSISSSLSAGISPENAFVMAGDDMEKLYGKRSAIVTALLAVNSQVCMGLRIEDAVCELAKREKIREIDDFAVVFPVAKQKGADFPRVISSGVDIMERRRNAEREAKIMIRARQYEQRVMCFIPPGILLYLRLSSQSFINNLYHNTLGVIIMTASLAVYVAAIFISEKIGDIRV